MKKTKKAPQSPALVRPWLLCGIVAKGINSGLLIDVDQYSIESMGTETFQNYGN